VVAREGAEGEAGLPQKGEEEEGTCFFTSGKKLWAALSNTGSGEVLVLAVMMEISGWKRVTFQDRLQIWLSSILALRQSPVSTGGTHSIFWHSAVVLSDSSRCPQWNFNQNQLILPVKSMLPSPSQTPRQWRSYRAKRRAAF
jgi:hypothetical protein